VARAGRATLDLHDALRTSPAGSTLGVHRAAIQARKEASAQRHIAHRPQLAAKISRRACPGSINSAALTSKTASIGPSDQCRAILCIQQLHCGFIAATIVASGRARWPRRAAGSRTPAGRGNGTRTI
jgi:hypothetical protein